MMAPRAARTLSSRRSVVATSAARVGPVRTTLRRVAKGDVKCRAEASSKSESSQGGVGAGEKMVVAVTGATGFIGKKLVEKLMEEGHEVRILTRNNLAARLALPQAALGGAKFYAHSNDASGGGNIPIYTVQQRSNSSSCTSTSIASQARMKLRRI